MFATPRRAARAASVFALAVLAAGFASAARAELLYGITKTNQLIAFESESPSAVLSTVQLTGLQAGEAVMGIDVRPALPANRLYLLGSSSRIYQVTNLMTGACAAVGGPFTPALSGTAFGFNFNPVADRIRVVSDADQNLRLDPDAGSVSAVDTPVAFAAGDFFFGRNPNVVAVSYTNASPGASSTTLYDIDNSASVLLRQDPPNSGTLSTVGYLQLALQKYVGFDISGATGVAYLSTGSDNQTRLYSVNLTTGQASTVGEIGHALCVRYITAIGQMGSTPVAPATWGTIKKLYR